MYTAPRARSLYMAAVFALLPLTLLLLAQPFRRNRSPEGDDLSRDALRGQELDESLRLSHWREQERHRLVVGVSQGRISLLEAAAGWMDLHRRAPFDLEKFREAHPADSDEERYCRGMIDMVADLLSDDDPCSAQAVRGRLERELDGLLRRGPLTLPDPPLGLEE